MIAPLAGSLLVARPELDDPHFRRTVVYLIEHNDDGAFGVIVNRPMQVELLEHLDLPAAFASAPEVFFEGGPVEDNAVIALGSNRLEPAEVIDVESLLQPGASAPQQVRFFAGYSGWSSGQLESELADEAWFVVDVQRNPWGSDDLFGAQPESLWRTVLRRQPPPLAALSLYPDDLMAN